MSQSSVVFLSIFLGGCLANTLDESTADHAVIRPNGVGLDGISPNALGPNGTSLNGIAPIGIGPNGGSVVAAAMWSPPPGAAVVGSTWTGLLSDGTALPLRIDSAVHGAGSNADVWSYGVSFQRAGTWHPLCADAAGAPLLADPVQGVWNHAQGVIGGGSYNPTAAPFTLACSGSSIAKCVELGYKPWAGQAGALAACVRALRADYCGDGVPHTADGTLVNLYDALGIQGDPVAWDPEAEWTPAGAACISRQRNTRFEQVAHDKPWCAAALKSSTCGSGFGIGGMIITELPPL